MARSLSCAKSLAASVAGGLSLSISRGYAAASQGALPGSLARAGPRTAMMGKLQKKAANKDDSEAASAWAPDPVTGYYRPGNCTQEIDPAELREMLLGHKVKPH